ncbi:S9 family peptidase, partial [Xanthomonas hortorum pv. cynarae]|nr:S9 family peptidase [Xanthomonas hortorum pv. cynarae]
REEYEKNRHWRRTTLLDADRPGTTGRVLFDLSTDDLYADPGLTEMRVLANGQAVLREERGALFLSGQGASPAGDRPFLDRYALASGKTQRLFRSDASVDELFFGFAGDDVSRLLTWHQSLTDPPNVYLRTLGQPLPTAATGEA